MLEPRIRDLLRAVIGYARRQSINCELLFHREHSSLIRLGNSAVALSTYEDLSRLDVTVQQGRRTGSFSLTADINSADQLRDALIRANESCTASIEKDYDPIFGTLQETIDDSGGYDLALENLSPEAKTEICSRVVRTLKPRGRYDFSGSWSSGSTELYYITTANDNEAYRRLTDARLVLVLKEQSQKWELSVERGGKAAAEFNAGNIIAEFDRMLPIYEANPGFKTQLGHQRVMFGPQAISQLVGLAVWGGFIGRAWEEKRAFTSGNQFGDKILSELVSISDDPTNPNVFGMPFDFKGIRRRPFPIVDKGVFRGLLYDTGTAARYKKAPTGHDLDSSDFVFAPADGPAGLDAGKRLAGDALYIPHLHYIHLPDPTRGMFTGSSRFNAQRLVNGEFVAPLFSTRITDTIPNVLSHVVAVSSESLLENVSATYGRRTPDAVSAPEYLICDNVRINDVADSF